MVGSRPCHAVGAALLICLMLLFALTFLGLAAATESQLHRRMGANMDTMSQAARAAEAGLAWAEGWLFSVEGGQRPQACDETCAADDVIRAAGAYLQNPESATPAWWADNAFPAGRDPVSGFLLEPALNRVSSQWLIEEVHSQTTEASADESPYEVTYYRIMARGADRSGGSVAVLESVIARPWGDGVWVDPMPPRRQVKFCHRLGLDMPCGRLAWRQLR